MPGFGNFNGSFSAPWANGSQQITPGVPGETTPIASSGGGRRPFGSFHPGGGEGSQTIDPNMQNQINQLTQLCEVINQTPGINPGIAGNCQQVIQQLIHRMQGFGNAGQNTPGYGLI
jgi:hypothetical protein